MADPEMIYVVPAEGRVVRDYRTNLPVPAEGMWAPADETHFLASIHLGDLKRAEAPPRRPDEAGDEAGVAARLRQDDETANETADPAAGKPAGPASE